MVGNCSICLSSLKEPVSIPCGHVYCTKCLSDHVNTPESENTTSSCPTCRSVFNIVTPDLAYLPKKYHQYVVPCVRRVYFDTSGCSSLQKQLAKAEAKIKKLEKDQETLIKQCEQYMFVAHGHANGEKQHRTKVQALKAEINCLTSIANADRANSNMHIKEVEQDRDALKLKYSKLKHHYRDLEARFNEDSITSMSAVKRRKSSADTDIPGPDRTIRTIRPLPRSRAEPVALLPTRSCGVSPSPYSSDRQKRPRLSAPILGATVPSG